MKFYAPTEQPIHVALTSGHTAVVTQDGTELPKAFHLAAIERGAHMEGGAGESELRAVQMTRELTIREALVAARDSNSPDAFNKDGTPDLRKLVAKLGFQVSREEADAIWAEVTEDA